MGDMLMPVKMSWQRLRQMILHREGGGKRSKPLSLSYKSSPHPVAKHHPLGGAAKRAATRDLLGLFLLAAAGMISRATEK